MFKNTLSVRVIPQQAFNLSVLDEITETDLQEMRFYCATMTNSQVNFVIPNEVGEFLILLLV